MKKETKLFGSESAHWYAEDGTPVFEVEKANGKGKTKTTLTQARKLGLYPSVTSIFKLLDKPQVNEWQLNHLLKAVQDTGITGDGLSTYEFKQILLSHTDKARSEGADEGTKIHEAAEKYLIDGIEPDNDKYFYICQGIKKLLPGGEVLCEESYTSTVYGYSGTVDISVDDGEYLYICDLKTTSDKNFDSYLKKPYDTWIMQLAAYSHFFNYEAEKIKLVSIVANRDNGEVGSYVWTEEEEERGWDMFKNLLDYWYLRHRYEVKKLI